MSINRRTPNVLIVDQDLGFLLWLGELFVEAGCHALPALNCSQALATTRNFHLRVDLLVVDPALFGITRLIESLNQPGAILRVVLMGNNTTTQSTSIHYDAILARPSGWEQVSRPDWLRKLKRLLAQFGFESSVPLTRQEDA